MIEAESNEIEYIPSEICDLTLLQSLNLAGNKLEELPENLGNLKSLINLNGTLFPLIFIPSMHINAY